MGHPRGMLWSGTGMISGWEFSDGWLWQYRSGSVDVSICRPGTGC